MKRCCKILALFILILATSVSLKGQKKPLDMYQPGIKSPGASNLGQFAEIPVTMFNGLPSIIVPLTTVNCGDISFPISLDYYAGGNRPSQHPGWTGLGWTLSAGGVITRQRNGDRDEYKDMQYPNADWSYWTNKGGLGASNWNTVGFLEHPPLGGSLSPDEFSFNVNGISGSFFLNYDGTWKVKSKQNIRVDVEVDPPTDYTIMIGTYADVLPRTFTKFTLITGDGTRYIFGGQQNAIEFSYPALPGKSYFGSIEAYLNYYQNNNYYNSVEAHAWHLVKIISPKGHTVDFMYSTAPVFTFNQTTYTYFHHVNTSNGNNTYGREDNEYNKNLVTVYYLEKILVDNNTEYSFSRSLSNELHWVWMTNTLEKDFALYGFGMNADDYKHYKLDNLKVKEAGNLIQDIGFEYIENTSERLKLKKVVFKETKTELRNVYEFEYNPKLLPPYNTLNEDHWGYNNGKLLYDIHTPNAASGAAYAQQREPDAAFMDAEMLQKVIYPSGGSSQFVFEPHHYSSVVSQYPDLVCNSINQNKIAGGLRIKKIINNDNVAGTVTKEFFYIKDYLTGGTLSSGVLSGMPKYYEEGGYNTSYGVFIRFHILSSAPLNFLNNTNGNHVTYSEVVERNGEGFIVYKFQNHDNGFLDHPASATYFPSTDINPDLYVNKAYAKRELERGLQTSESYYSAGQQLLKEVKYDYNDDPNRYEDNVRCVFVNMDYPVSIVAYMSSYPIYTFFPFLKKETIKEYSQNGGGNAVVTTKEFEYDVATRNLKREKFTTSTGEQIITDYKYPSDLVTAGQDPAGIYNAMVQKHILSAVVESKTARGSIHLSTTRTNFHSPAAGIYVPASVYVQDKNDPMAPRLLLNRYDSKGNLLELQKTNDIKQVYLWGYNSRYPVARIIGADYHTVSNIVNQSVLNNPPGDQALRTELEKLRTNLPNAMVSTYTYSPLRGITSETNPQGKSLYYEYDGFNRLTLIRDQDNNIIKMICYNYAGQPENCKKSEYNTEQWRMFTRNNCGTGYIGGEWKVVVPAYTFFSYINVNDANAKALAFINATGQDEANKKGSCTLICTTENCTGINKKCINNVCETGNILLESSVPMGGGSYWMCTYRYQFSDGSVSDSFIEWSPGECLSNPY